jgi:acyl carrier protein
MADELIKLFSETLNVDASLLSDESSPDTLEKWDSLAAMNLVSAIEEEFEVELTTKEIMKMYTIGMARQLLQNKSIDV